MVLRIQCAWVFNTASGRDGFNRTVVFWLRKKSEGCGEIRGITRIDDMACAKKFPDGLLKTVYKISDGFN
jgi:hypothetical protein